MPYVYIWYILQYITCPHDVLLIFQARQGSSHSGSGSSGGGINSGDTDDWNRSLEQKTQEGAEAVENYGYNLKIFTFLNLRGDDKLFFFHCL